MVKSNILLWNDASTEEILGPFKWYFTIMCCKSTSCCSTTVTEELVWAGLGREGVRGNCTYKLFKLYEMHVVYTCLSIYIWCMNIFVLFIEKKSSSKRKKNVYKKDWNKLWTHFKTAIQSLAAKVLYSKTLHVPWPVWLQNRDRIWLKETSCLKCFGCDRFCETCLSCGPIRGYNDQNRFEIRDQAYRVTLHSQLMAWLHHKSSHSSGRHMKK